MRLVTLKDGTPDGALAVVSDDGTRFLKIGDSLPNLLQLMEDWDAGQAILAEARQKLAAGQAPPPCRGAGSGSTARPFQPTAI